MTVVYLSVLSCLVFYVLVAGCFGAMLVCAVVFVRCCCSLDCVWIFIWWVVRVLVFASLV